jgi:hypothetical protein
MSDSLRDHPNEFMESLKELDAIVQCLLNRTGGGVSELGMKMSPNQVGRRRPEVILVRWWRQVSKAVD